MFQPCVRLGLQKGLALIEGQIWNCVAWLKKRPIRARRRTDSCSIAWNSLGPIPVQCDSLRSMAWSFECDSGMSYPKQSMKWKGQSCWTIENCRCLRIYINCLIYTQEISGKLVRVMHILRFFGLWTWIFLFLFKEIADLAVPARISAPHWLMGDL